MRAWWTAILVCGSAATLAAGVAFAQDEKPGAKKPKPEAGEKAKKGETGDKTKKGDDADKKGGPPADLDPKQKKWVEKQRQDIEKKLKKTKKETIYVFSLHEKGYELITPEAADDPPAEGGKKPRGGVKTGSTRAMLEPYTKSEIFQMEDREAAIEKIYAYVTEYPPQPKKKKSKDEPETAPPPVRSWESHGAVAKTKEGEVQAAAMLEKIGDKYKDQDRRQEMKKEKMKKGK